MSNRDVSKVQENVARSPTTESVSDTRKHIWQIIYHFIAFFKLNLGIMLLFALAKPAACISQMKISFKLEVVLS